MIAYCKHGPVGSFAWFSVETGGQLGRVAGGGGKKGLGDSKQLLVREPQTGHKYPNMQIEITGKPLECVSKRF